MPLLYSIFNVRPKKPLSLTSSISPYSLTLPVVADWKEQVKKAGYNPDQVMDEFKAALKKENALF